MNKATGEQTFLSWRKQGAGQRLVVGVPAEGVTDEFREFVRKARPAGFILFARNVEEPAQVVELNRELAALLPDSLPPLLTVDQEGGRVQRVRATEWPPMRWLGNADDLSLTKRFGRALGQEVRALGFNTDWTPVADVDSNPNNPVIGDRSFGSSAEVCARHVKALIEGLHAEGVISCAKHYPGHGDTAIDSHLDLPVVEKDPDDLEHCEQVPFACAIAAGVPIIMTAHVVFPTLDEELPATMSSAILQGLLRGRLGFEGVVVSDDMEMKAVRGRYPIEYQLDCATRATVDLFLVCHELEFMWTCWETLVRQQEQDVHHEQLTEDSNRRLHSLRKRFFLGDHRPPNLEVVGCEAHRDLALEVAARGQS